MSKNSMKKCFSGVGLSIVMIFLYNIPNIYADKVMGALEETNILTEDQQILLQLPIVICAIIISVILSVFLIKLFFESKD